MHAQNSTRASLCGQVRLALWGVLLGNHKLDEERVSNLGAISRLGVAGVLELAAVGLELVQNVVKLHVDCAVRASVVRLPSLVEVLLT